MWALRMSSMDAEIPHKSKFLSVAMLAPDITARDLMRMLRGSFAGVSEEGKSRWRAVGWRSAPIGKCEERF